MKMNAGLILPALLVLFAAMLTGSVDKFEIGKLEFLLIIASISAVLYVLTGKNQSKKSTDDRLLKHNIGFSKSLIDSSTDAIVVLDYDLVVKYFNHSAEKMFGYMAQNVIGNSVMELLGEPIEREHMLRFVALSVKNKTPIKRSINQSLYTQYGEELKTSVRLTASILGGHTYYIFHVQDITAKLEAEDKLFQAMYNDNLTGLPNKTIASQHIQRGIEDAQRDGRNLVVMKIGLDRFKRINESMSHEFGDQLIVNIAKRLERDLRRGDLVSRINGDQFVVTLVDVNKTTNIDHLVRKYIDIFSQSFYVDKKEIHVSASIGIACYPDDGSTIEALLRNAESAMFLAKTKGGVNYRYYSQELREKSRDRLHLENELRGAISQNQLEVFYQPQVDLKSGKIVGVEALIRWLHPELGSISPVKFIPLAEEIGLISEIGQWVMKRACSDMVLISKERNQILNLSINLSAYQFSEVDLVVKIAEVLNKTGFPAERLELEITESLFMEDVDEVVNTLNILSKQGISISMDDFGTGYSSLSYLKRFPIDTIKVDRSFVKDVTSDHDNASIVTATIQMAHSLSLDIVAEGVETEEQLRFLVNNECDKMQGFYFSRPLCFKALNNLLEENRLIELNSDKICLISGYR